MSSEVAELERPVDAVPVDWQQTTLGGALAKSEGGGTPPRDVEEYWNGDIPWASVKDVVKGEGSTPEETITPAGLANSTSKLIAAGTNIFAARMGVGAVVRYPFPVAINQDLMALTPSSELDPGYLFYWLQARKEAFVAVATGTTVKGIRKDVLLSFPMVLPPLDEQRRIAEVLRSVDEAIAAAAIVQETTRTLLDSVRHHAFSGAEESIAFSDVITLVSGQHVDTARCNKEGMGVPYLTGPSDFPDGEIIITKFTTAPSVMCHPGDILITVKGSGVGKAVIADSSYCISRQLMAIRSTELPTAFLFEALQLVVQELNAEASGPIPGITRGHILVKPIPVMERGVQESLAATFRSLREQLRLASGHLEMLGLLKSSLMSDLLAGRVRVPA